MPRALGVPAHAPLWLKRAQRLLVSLLAAVFVWLSIINQQDPMVIRSAVNIPVPCPQLDPSLECQDIEDTLTARLRAPQSAWSDLNPPFHQYLTVALTAENPDADFATGTHRFRCRMDSAVERLEILAFGRVSEAAGLCNVRIAFRAAPAPDGDARADAPSNRRVTLPVTLERVGEIPDGFALESLALDHQYVTLVGAPEQVALAARALAYIPLYSYAFHSLQGRFEMPVSVQIADRDGNILSDVTVEPASLTASLTYSPLPNTRQVRIAPQTALEVPSGYTLVQVKSDPEHVILQGPTTLLETVPDPLRVPIADAPASLTRTTTLTAPLTVPAGAAANVEAVTFTWEVAHVMLNNTQRAQALCLQAHPDWAYDFGAVFLHLRGPFEAFDRLYEMEAGGDFQWQVLYDCPAEEGTFSLRASRFVFQHADVEASALITLISHDPPMLNVRVRAQPAASDS